MSFALNNLPVAKGRSKWQLLSLIGLVAVTAGLVVPQLLPSVSLQPPAQPPTPPKSEKWQYTPPAFAEGPDLKAMLLRLGVGTALVLGLCVATLLVAKRWLGDGIQAAATGQQMRLLETLPVGRRCSVLLLAVGSQQVLVGVDASGVKSMVALPPAFEPQLLGLENAEAATAEEQREGTAAGY